ncbi:hypothetical protein ACFOQM_20895 [Paenibacillus sp. GCM10012307]|nr:hypothetical protein [Paenibacillus roseus]
MPINRSEKTENQNNESRMKEEARTVKGQKAAQIPPNLNGISKQP